jgi:hypothetical protein
MGRCGAGAQRPAVAAPRKKGPERFSDRLRPAPPRSPLGNHADPLPPGADRARCGHPGQQHGRRFPSSRSVRARSMCLRRVSGVFTDSTQQIHSLRASGVMSSHLASAAASQTSASRRSAGSSCTTPALMRIPVMRSPALRERGTLAARGRLGQCRRLQRNTLWRPAAAAAAYFVPNTNASRWPWATEPRPAMVRPSAEMSLTEKTSSPGAPTGWGGPSFSQRTAW